MRSKGFSLLFCIFAISVFWIQSSAAAAQEHTNDPKSESTTATTLDLQGTWSGTFLPKHQNANPFTITIVIAPDSNGVLSATSSLESDCIKDPRLQVTITGSKVVLVGSDADGGSIMFRGKPDNTGTVLTLNYVSNGSATGKCETDTGTGTLGKRLQ